MHDDRWLVEQRIERVMRDRIRPAVLAASVPFDLAAWEVPGEPVGVSDARAADYEPFAVGTPWGRPWGTTWFRLQATPPPEWLDRRGHTVVAVIDFGNDMGPGFQSEGLIYRTSGGGPVHGVHPDHRVIPVRPLAASDGPIDILVEAASNPVIGGSFEPTELGDPATAGRDPLYRFNVADLALRDDEVYHLDVDLSVLYRLMADLPENDGHRHDLLRAIERAVTAFERAPDATQGAVLARAELAPLLSRPARPDGLRLAASGHAHIDTAWLWPLRETRRKCARTFATALTLMEDFPEYRFVCSQAAQYDWIEHDHPELFDRIRGAVAAGRFVPVGSMWVEADANLPSGESLARQFVWGKRYFSDRFGIETTEVWIPDVFGYAGSLPQLMVLAGCRRFLTQKLSWNQTNVFPHQTFRWEGIDGSRVFTHFPPADTYNGNAQPDQLRHAARNFKDKGRAHEAMYLFGHGDGGGGPTREMLERLRRLADLAGVPAVDWRPPSTFFADAERDYPDAPVWRGELYFEMHRGTYTSQSRTKWGNRRAELALRELEVWTATEAHPPLDDLERLWKVVLLHQFHDIIPGSSIAWVHDDTEAAHDGVLAEIDQRLGAILGAGGDAMANAGPFDRAEVIVVDDGPRWVSAPALGIGTASSRPASVAPVTIRREPGVHVLANGLIRVEIASDGRLASVRDLRADRECLAGPGNELQLFADHPTQYDAWDLDAHTLAAEPTVLIDVESISAVATDDLRAAVRVHRRFGASTMAQTYVVRAGSARLDIETEIDWHEDERLLKAAFPLDLRVDDARYDIQYGHVRRPTHRNTSWDAARFEVCGHFWADVTEPGFGVAVLNDGKYGHDCVGAADRTTMRLSLLRAPNYPDPDADRGHHRFTYSLLPHAGRLEDVIAESWALNLPLRPTSRPPASSLVAVDHPGVVITACKAADDGTGDLIVRAHEALGGRARTTLRIPPETVEAAMVDLLEDPLEVVGGAADLDVSDGAVRLELRPFQIVTIRLRRS